MSGYFKFFPTILYPYQGKMVGDNNSKIQYIECVDLMVRYRIKDIVLQNPLSYYFYEWKDNERPDQVARKYYGDVRYTWLVLFSAEVYDWLYDLPMGRNVFEKYLEDKYQQTANELTQIIHHYEDGDGAIIDLDTYISIPDTKKKPVSVYDYEFSANESRRKVKLLSRQYLSDVNNEFVRELRDLAERRRLFIGEFSL